MHAQQNGGGAQVRPRLSMESLTQFLAGVLQQVSIVNGTICCQCYAASGQLSRPARSLDQCASAEK